MSKLQTAYHEAGHAVVGAVLGAVIKSADITPNLSRNGACEYHPPDYCVSQIAIMRAGSMAVWEYQWRSGKPMDYGAYGDLELIDAKLNRWYYDEAPPRDECDEYTEAEPLVNQTLADYWGAIEAVAKYLITHDSIRGVLVHEIVKRHQQQAKVHV